jgi:hypothetical protein
MYPWRNIYRVDIAFGLVWVDTRGENHGQVAVWDFSSDQREALCFLTEKKNLAKPKDIY